MAMEGFLDRALFKLHYKREYPVFNSWSSVTSVNFGKIQEEGQSAVNFMAEDASLIKVPQRLYVKQLKFIIHLSDDL